MAWDKLEVETNQDRNFFEGVLSDEVGEFYYIGELVGKQPNGRGIQVFEDELRYEGVFRDGKLNGYGRSIDSAGIVSKGSW